MKTKIQTMDLLVPDLERYSEKKETHHQPSWTLTDRQICDLELLMNGGFAPLNGFMKQNDYNSVLEDMRLNDGSLWPIPITLDMSEEFTDKVISVDKITLRDKEGFALAVLTISDIWQPDLEKEAEAVYGTKDATHPAVNYLYNISNNSTTIDFTSQG